MNLNKNYMSKYVIGKEYSYSTLKSMTKDELIKHLDIAQHNYEVANERLFNLTQYAEKLNKALDKACTELVKLKECADCWEYEEYCPFRNECKEGTNYCYDIKCWKERLLKDD